MEAFWIGVFCFFLHKILTASKEDFSHEQRGHFYSRDNHDSEMDNLEAQIEECSKCAEQNGYQVIGCYTDTASALSAITERSGWNALLDVCRKGDVRCVIETSEDRIVRSRQELYDCLAPLKETGTAVIFAEGKAL